MTISNYWWLKDILSHYMNEIESFEDLVRITVSTFKEDVEKGLVHMKNMMHPSKYLFQRYTNGNNDEDDINAIEDDAESSRKA